MKKILIAIFVLLGSISLANAEKFRVGVSVMGAGFEADGAEERFTGNHSSNTSTTDRTIKSSTEKENAEGAFALGSVFAEFQAIDEISLGVSYVPHSSDSEETENIQNMGTSFTAQATNKVKVFQNFPNLNNINHILYVIILLVLYKPCPHLKYRLKFY